MADARLLTASELKDIAVLVDSWPAQSGPLSIKRLLAHIESLERALAAARNELDSERIQANHYAERFAASEAREGALRSAAERVTWIAPTTIESVPYCGLCHDGTVNIGTAIDPEPGPCPRCTCELHHERHPDCFDALRTALAAAPAAVWDAERALVVMLDDLRTAVNEGDFEAARQLAQAAGEMLSIGRAAAAARDGEAKDG